MSDELPAIPVLRFTHEYDVLISVGAGNNMHRVSHQTIRDRVSSRQSEGYEFVDLYTLGQFVRGDAEGFISELGGFAVTVMFKKSNVDAQGAALRAIAEDVRTRLATMEAYRVTVAQELKTQVDALRHDVQLAVEGPITEAIKDDLEERFVRIEEEISKLKAEA